MPHVKPYRKNVLLWSVIVLLCLACRLPWRLAGSCVRSSMRHSKTRSGRTHLEGRRSCTGVLHVHMAAAICLTVWRHSLCSANACCNWQGSCHSTSTARGSTDRVDVGLCRVLQSQHAATVQQELTSWHQQQGASALAAEAEKSGLAQQTAWQLVQLAERVVECRQATGGQAVPLADWRSWLSLFLAGGLV